MKKLILFSCFVTISASLLAQTGKETVKPVSKTKLPPSTLKTLNDSASYAIGLSIGGFCKQHSITSPDRELIAKSFTDVMNDSLTLMSETVINDIINKLMMQGKMTDHPAGNPMDSTQLITNTNDSVSYAIGFNHSTFFKQQGITSLDIAIIIKALNDLLGSKPQQFNDRTANTVMNKLIIQIQEDKVKPAIDAGRSFLTSNKKNPKVKTTASGLQYEVISLGKGIKPLKADTFVCHYRGTLIDGTKVDASYDRGEPLIFPVGSVIKGWTEGLQLMPVGSKYKFYIPYNLAYGVFDNPPIPGGSVLIFEVELLNVKKFKPAKKPTPAARK